MSDCHFLPLISVYHDGELPDDRTAEVERHLAHCGDCRTELTELRALSASMGEIDLPTMPVTSRLRLRKQASVFAVARRVRFVRMMTAVAAAIFIVAASMLAFQQFWTTKNPPPGIQVEDPHSQPSEKSSEPAVWNQPGGQR
jgi:anti-sigma factor RsiW